MELSVLISFDLVEGRIRDWLASTVVFREPAVDVWVSAAGDQDNVGIVWVISYSGGSTAQLVIISSVLLFGNRFRIRWLVSARAASLIWVAAD